MVTHPLYNNFTNSTEQEMLEDMIVESIKIYGMDMYYIPMRRNSFDEIYYEDDQASYDTAYPIEIYIKNVDGFRGQGAFLSKFGLEIRDQAIFCIARRTFAVEITKEEPMLVRPRERDLIYFPMNEKVFMITFVNKAPAFYQLGDLNLYELTVELYEYSNESFNTGIPGIDSIQGNASFDAFAFAILSEDGFAIMAEDNTLIAMEEYIDIIDTTSDPGQDNISIEDEIDIDDVIDWSEDNPFADGRY
jgi:hypothetical protein